MINVNKPVENPVLKELMQAVKNNNCEENVNAFLEEIVLNAHFLSAIKFSDLPTNNGDGTAVFDHDTDMTLQLLVSQDDKVYYPVFTDWKEINKLLNEEVNSVILDFNNFVALIEHNNISGIVINPFDENMILERQMIMYLSKKREYRK